MRAHVRGIVRRLFLLIGVMSLLLGSTVANTAAAAPTAMLQEGDLDADGVANDIDNCPEVANPDQADSDGNGVGDVCEVVVTPDDDLDGVANEIDNCANVANPDQADTDGNGVGDVCEIPVEEPEPVPTEPGPFDSDADGLPDEIDNCADVANPDQTDIDGDGIGDACDPVFDEPTPMDTPAADETPPADCCSDDNTTPGLSVQVAGLGYGDVSVTFAEVLTAGVTSAEPIGRSALLTGYAWSTGYFFDIETSAEFTGPVTICVSYNPLSYGDPSTIELFHGDGSAWSAISTSNDPVAGMVCGAVSSLSPFAIAEALPTGSLLIRAQDWYGAPQASLPLTVHMGSCGEPGIDTVTGVDGTVLVEDLDAYTSVCISAGALAVSENYSYIQPYQTTNLTITVGERPAEGFVVLELQDENGIPLTAEQLISSACVTGSPADGGGDSRACDADSENPVRDGRIVFGNYPITTLNLLNYVPPFGYVAIDLPTAISGFEPGVTKVVGVRHRHLGPVAAALAVRVVDEDGDALPGVCIYPQGSYGCGGSTGPINYDVIVLTGAFPAGETKLAVGGGAPGKLYGPRPQVITIDADQTVEQVTVTLERSLVLRPVDSTGQPVFSCFTIYDAAASFFANACTTANGTVTVYNLPPGTYTVEPNNHGDYTTQFVGTITVENGVLIDTEILFTLPSTPSLTLTIETGNGNPLPGVCAQAMPAGASSCAGQDGIARFFDLEGEVQLLFWDIPTGYVVPEPVTIDLAASNELTLVVDQLPASLEVHAVSAEEATISGFCAYPANDMSYAYGCDDTQDDVPGDGSVTLRGMDVGDYTLQIFRPGFDTITMPITIASGTPLVVTVTMTSEATTSNLIVETRDATGVLIPGACYSLLRAGEFAYSNCDHFDGRRDGVISWDVNRYGTLSDGQYSLIETITPVGLPRAATRIVTLGSERPTNVVVAPAWELNTALGSGVVISPPGNSGVSVTFDNVNVAGATTVTVLTDGSSPELPGGFSIDGGLFFDISTTAGFVGPVTVCLPYHPASFAEPASLALLHYEGGAWTDVTVSNDWTAGIICGVVTSLSPFAVVQETGPIDVQPGTFVVQGPIATDGTLNTAKGGSSVVLNFDFIVDGVEQTNIGAIETYTVTAVSCANPATVLSPQPARTGSISLSFTDHFLVKWKSPKSPGTCFQIQIIANDGATLTAVIKLK